MRSVLNDEGAALDAVHLVALYQQQLHEYEPSTVRDAVINAFLPLARFLENFSVTAAWSSSDRTIVLLEWSPLCTSR